MSARLAILVALVLLLTTASQPAAAGWLVLDPPVSGPVLAGFHAPTRYGPGHRGVDLGAALGTPVRASAAGRVTFAGPVVGSLWVTVDHGPLRTTVGPLGSVGVAAGDRVGRGAVLGTSGRAHGTAAVHWSARRGEVYVDPRATAPLVATLLPAAGPPTTSLSRPPPGPPVSWSRHRVR